MLSVLVVGAGAMGKTHIQAYAKMDNVKVVGIADPRTPEQLDVNNVPIFPSFEKAIEQLKKIDVVDICLPTYLHEEYVKKAAELGKHIICEKPIARTLEEAKEMIDICKTNGVKLFVGHVVRFFPEYRQAQNLIDSGVIGKPGIIRTSRNTSLPKNARKEWYSNYNQSGGVILDLLIHDFDFLRSCFGEVKRVFAKSILGRDFAEKDYALVTLRFEGGAIAHVEGSWSHEGFTTKYEFAGDKGIIEFDSTKNRPLINNGDVISPKGLLQESTYQRELAHFIDCIESDKEPIVTAEDACKALEIALAAIQSTETNKPVFL